MSDDGDSGLQEFPCRFPIKVMGRDTPEFRQLAVKLVERHAGKLDTDAVRIAPSRNRNFTALTITIDATGKEQLDKIYRDLSAQEEVLIAL